MAGAGELLCRSESRRTGADNGHVATGRDGRRLRLDGAVHPGLIGDRLLDPLDGDTAAGLLFADRQHAGRLARRGTQPPGELREIVRGVQTVTGGVPAAATHQIVPLRDEVAQRAARGSGVAERNSAVHAPAGLLADLPGALMRVLLFVDLSPVADALVHRPFGGLDLHHLKKSLRISHESPP